MDCFDVRGRNGAESGMAAFRTASGIAAVTLRSSVKRSSVALRSRVHVFGAFKISPTVQLTKSASSILIAGVLK